MKDNAEGRGENRVHAEDFAAQAYRPLKWTDACHCNRNSNTERRHRHAQRGEQPQVNPLHVERQPQRHQRAERQPPRDDRPEYHV